MDELTRFCENLKKRGIEAKIFATGAEAAAYVVERAAGKTVGIGGSVTVRDLGLYETLKERGEVYWHWMENTVEMKKKANFADLYLCSVNGAAVTGELVNIDGAGNRVSAMTFGPKELMLLVGKNKLTPDLASALHRAKHVAAPINARRVNAKTPCFATGKCIDCASPGRICNQTLILERPAAGMKVEVLAIDEELGF